MMKHDSGSGLGPRTVVAERRRSPRLDHETIGLIRPDVEDAYASDLEVKVIDVARLGVGFRAPVPLPLGGMYRIRIGAGPLHLESRLRVTACCRRADGVFHVGAEFV